jgi:hypothetical protein
LSELEIFVLEGELSLAEQTLSGGWFAHLSAAVAQGRLVSAGAQAQLFFAGPPDFVPAPAKPDAAPRSEAYLENSRLMRTPAKLDFEFHSDCVPAESRPKP